MLKFQLVQITVNKKDRTLTIGGERKRASKAVAEPVDADSQKQEQPKQQQQFRQRHERIMGKFSRTLQRLPEDADLTAVSARCLSPPPSAWAVNFLQLESSSSALWP